MSEIFDQSFQYFLDNQDRIPKEYEGKVIAIYQDRVLGVYSSKLEAYHKVPTDHNVDNGTFVIKDYSVGSAQHDRVYQSNIHFSDE